MSDDNLYDRGVANTGKSYKQQMIEAEGKEIANRNFAKMKASDAYKKQAYSPDELAAVKAQQRQAQVSMQNRREAGM